VLGALVVLVVCLGWGIAAGMPYQSRLHPFLIRHAAGKVWRGALVSAAVQLAALLGFGVLAMAAHAVGGAAGAALTVLVAFAYSPVPMSAMPAQYGGYGEARAELRRAGARRPVDRGITWAGGPVAVLGTCVLVAAMFATFAP